MTRNKRKCYIDKNQNILDIKSRLAFQSNCDVKDNLGSVSLKLSLL